MALATCLRDLLRIRQKNIRSLRSIPGCLGTAVGFKYNEKTGQFEESGGRRKPAILVFVREKIPLAALSPEDRVPAMFTGPGGIECYSDVVVGKPPQTVQAAAPDTGINGQIVHDLKHTVTENIGGVPIEGPGFIGTAGVMLRMSGGLAALTNYHVAEFEHTRMLRVGALFEILGNTSRSILLAPAGTSDPDDLESFTDAAHRVDVGAIALNEVSTARARPGVFGLQPLGRPFALNLRSRDFSPIGRNVVSVGQQLGRQEGRILAYGYEYKDSLDEQAQWFITDYLIQSSGELPFAAPGDSGKLVVTNDESRQPIALLWGGEQHFFGNIPAQATMAYGTDIGLVLKLLDNAEINWSSCSSAP